MRYNDGHINLDLSSCYDNEKWGKPGWRSMSHKSRESETRSSRSDA